MSSANQLMLTQEKMITIESVPKLLYTKTQVELLKSIHCILLTTMANYSFFTQRSQVLNTVPFKIALVPPKEANILPR